MTARATQLTQHAGQEKVRADQAVKRAGEADQRAHQAAERADQAADQAKRASERAEQLAVKAERLQGELDRLRQADAGTAAVEQVAGEIGKQLRAPLTALGDELDQVLDSPEMSAIQRHLLLAAIQTEHRRLVGMIDQLEGRARDGV